MLALRAMKMNGKFPIATIVLVLLVSAACIPQSDDDQMVITVIADGRQRSYFYPEPIPVIQFLELEEVGVTVDENDRINPPRFTQLADGMTITVVHVTEEVSCEDITVPFQQSRVEIEGLEPGAERLGHPGVNGIERVCYRSTFWDGEINERVEISRVQVEAPQDEVVWVGADTTVLEVVPITGTLAYISNHNAWIMRGSSATKRPLTNSGRLDGLVFALSGNGQHLLYTQSYDDTAEDAEIYFNTLWAILDTRSNEPVAYELNLLNNILYADWVPNEPYTFSYSAGEARPNEAPGWQAFNDLWLMRIDENDARLLSPRNLVESSAGGVYGWWGTDFQWASDGSALAWSRADSAGLVDLETGEFQTLLQFPIYLTYQDWVWQPVISWSPDNNMILATVHGPPFGTEQPENSPVFNIAVAAVDGSFQTEIVTQAGMWSAPQFSPYLQQESEFPQGYLAYLQARHPLNSLNDEYDLLIADRDGSNARRVFPDPGRPGITLPQFTWSPDGRQVAVIYQGNLWVVDVSSGRAQQLTVDGQASEPRWVP